MRGTESRQTRLDPISPGVAALELPADRPRARAVAAPSGDERMDEVTIRPSLERIARLDDLVGEAPATGRFAILLGALTALVHRYTGEACFTIVCPVDVIRKDGSRSGPSPLPIAVRFSPHTDGFELVRSLDARLQQQLSEGLAAPEGLARTIPEAGAVARTVTRIQFGYAGCSLAADPSGAGRTICSSSRAVTMEGLEPAELVVVAEDDGDGILVRLRYDEELFDRPTVERMARHWDELLAGLAADPGRTVARMPLLTPEERELILVEWNRTESPYPAERCLHELFEERVERHPDAPAVVCGEREVSYGELSAQVAALARRLVAEGVGPDVRVGLAAERSLEMVVGILGVLAAGGAYVPLEPTYPRRRLETILDDARPAVLLAPAALRESLPRFDGPMVDLDLTAREPGSRRLPAVDPECLCYVIYTSGSTGRPKGIAVRHRGVVNNVVDLNERFRVGPGDRCLAVSSLSFDMCVYEVLGMLVAGATVVMPDADRYRDPAHWVDLVDRRQVSIWNSAPQLLELLLDRAEREGGRRLASLRLAILGGDWVPLSLPDRFRAHSGGARGGESTVAVLGGATEASIHSTLTTVEAIDPAWRSIPYGRPMRNQRVYVLDAALEPLPVGVPGRLFLGGVGLARGYFDRPDRTAERFLPDPFLGDGSRIYDTGDRVRWMPTGELELLGRVDHQVKVRGHRVELDEIAAVLRDQAAVEDAVVTLREDRPGDERLVAYVVWEDEPDDGGGDETAQVEQWRSVYDEIYGESDEAEDPASDFSGWVTSYDGRPFSSEELTETVESTAATILALEPRRVLEIGCGSGLILYRVAPQCERYDASDVSAVVIDELEERLTRVDEDLSHVRLAVREATDFSPVPSAAYDTVILSSITQHFPSVDYLLRVLEGSLSALAEGGSIVLADVRCLPLLEAFHASLELFGSPQTKTLAELRRGVRERAEREKELWIDPQLFRDLPALWPRLRRVELRLRRGRHMNEITRFHYDVVLGTAAGPGEEGGIVVEDALNARLREERRLVEWIERGDAEETVASWRREASRTTEGPWRDPEEEMARLGTSSGVAWAAWPRSGNPWRFDVLMGGAPEASAVAVEGLPRPVHLYGNTPMRRETSRRREAELRDAVARTLPPHMVPAAVVSLEALPLSPNGKVDRRALPAPADVPTGSGAGGAAMSDLERALEAIWTVVLDLPRVGREDGFFDVGGHSLTAMQLVSRVSEIFDVDIPLRVLFDGPELHRFATRVEAICRREGVDAEGVATEVLAHLAAVEEAETEPLPSREEA